MKKLLYLLPAVLVAVFAVSSCKSDSGEDDIKGEIAVDKTEISFGAASGSAVLTVKSSYSWTASVDKVWLTIDPKSGDSDKEYKIKVSAKQNTSDEERTAVITIKSGSAEKEIAVSQKAGVGDKKLRPEDVQDYDKIYMGSEFNTVGRNWNRSNTFHDPLESSSFYSFVRSKQSEHFIIFWDPDYGAETPSEAASPYHVDLDSFLDWCEQIYKYYIDVLKFAHFTDAEKSYLDKYKFQIYLWHQTEWAAYGSGPDDNITGCLWINPEAANSRSTVAHEIGHSFQYQVACDLKLNGLISDIYAASFRYNTGQASTFWEQCAQWNAALMCPEEALNDYYFSNFCDEANRHFLHEAMRYGSYYLQYYWAEKRGIDAVASVWHEARQPNDALQTYMKVYGIDNDQLNDEIYDYASHAVTWDIDRLREDGVNHLNAFRWNASKDADGYWMSDTSDCLEATGFNVIRLGSFKKGETVKAEFVGLPDAPGYNTVAPDASKAGWKIGFVALGSDKSTRTYSEAPAYATAATGNKATVEFTVPRDVLYLYAVVTCAPTTYMTHLWDDNNANDVHWPYKVRFTGADVYQTFSHSYSMEDHKISVNADIDSDAAYSKGGFEIFNFTLPVDKVSDFIGQDVATLDESSFVGYNPDGKATDFTSYKPGMWSDNTGKATSWDKGCAYWQWYIWGGKTDKNGSKITYDHDSSGSGENKGMFIVGTNHDNLNSARGHSVVFSNKITPTSGTHKGETFDFVVTFNFSK